MQSFCRMSKLSNIGGRGDYISNPARQEKILAKSEPVDWKPYQEFEAARQKTLSDQHHVGADGKEVVYKCSSCEGRELIIALPNEWADLPEPELAARAQHLAVKAIGKETDLQWAVHWNKDHTNLHMHVIFSERQKIKEPGRWDRDIYLTDDGKVARRKSDRRRLPDGSIAPPVHKKGDLKDGFSVKNTDYASKGWLYRKKQELASELQLRWNVVIDPRRLLHEYHEGKGSESPVIKAKNAVIRLNNEQFEKIRGIYPNINKTRLRALMRDAAAKEQVVHVEPQGDRYVTFSAPVKSHQRIESLKKLISDIEVAYAQHDELRSQLNSCTTFQVKKKRELKKELKELSSVIVPLNKQARALLPGFDSYRANDLISALRDHLDDMFPKAPAPTKAAAEKKPLHQTLDEYKQEIAREKARPENQQQQKEKTVRKKSEQEIGF